MVICNLHWYLHVAVYEPLKLMQTVMNKLNEICLRYLDNSQLDKLPAPGETSLPEVSVCASRNYRRRMEDRHVIIHDLNTMFSIEVNVRGGCGGVRASNPRHSASSQFTKYSRRTLSF